MKKDDRGWMIKKMYNQYFYIEKKDLSPRYSYKPKNSFSLSISAYNIRQIDMFAVHYYIKKYNTKGSKNLVYVVFKAVL